MSKFAGRSTGVVTRQKGSTCWANSLANVIFQTKRRSRDPNYHELSKERKKKKIDEIIRYLQETCHKTTESGYSVKKALEKVKGHYKITWVQVDEKRAKENVNSDPYRYVLATYRFDRSWNRNFRDFFERNGEGIFRKHDAKSHGTDKGHAVVFVGTEGGKCLVFKNSKGGDWGDKGKFRVKDTSSFPKIKFYEVRNR